MCRADSGCLCSSRTGEAQRPGLNKRSVPSAQFGKRLFVQLSGAAESWPPAGAGPGGLHRTGDADARRTDRTAKDVRSEPEPATLLRTCEAIDPAGTRTSNGFIRLSTGQSCGWACLRDFRPVLVVGMNSQGF
jgi:hypothetical protein